MESHLSPPGDHRRYVLSMTFDPMVTEDVLANVGAEMARHTFPFLTPISAAITYSQGQSIGSGTFLKLNDAYYVITNEHVAETRNEYRLAFFGGNNQHAIAIIHPFRCITQPTDAAIARIDDEIFPVEHKSAVTNSRIEHAFAPSEGEIVFLHGYPGITSYFSPMMKTLINKTCPYATDVADLPPKYDPDLHFAINYPAPGKEAVKDFDGNPVDLPDPHGLSGTLLWDTKYIGKNGENWSPTDAMVTGIIHQWDTEHQLLIGTKIEILRVFLVDSLRQEAAYFNWLKRGKPLDESMIDWYSAIETVPDI